mmetsp:Transcript_17021/g.34162  ORF Transcript_17021/g.34162 Transcript_17021/m.34162 type:complete len:116 (+) Transcript_17021:581-928(+)
MWSVSAAKDGFNNDMMEAKKIGFKEIARRFLVLFLLRLDRTVKQPALTIITDSTWLWSRLGTSTPLQTPLVRIEHVMDKSGRLCRREHFRRGSLVVISMDYIPVVLLLLGLINTI